MCLEYSVEVIVFELVQITVSKMQVMFNKLHVCDIKENGDNIQEYNPHHYNRKSNTT